MLTQKLQYFGHLMRRADSLEKTLMLERLRAGGEGEHRRRDGWVASSTIDESEQTPQNSEGQGNLAIPLPPVPRGWWLALVLLGVVALALVVIAVCFIVYLGAD